MGVRVLEVTETCPRCKGEGKDPNSFYMTCIRCNGNRKITTTRIELSPSFVAELIPFQENVSTLENLNLEILEKDDPRTKLDGFVSLMDPDLN